LPPSGRACGTGEKNARRRRDRPALSASGGRQCRQGLRLRERFGRGGTEIGVARATELKNREKLAPSTTRRMVSYFARHEVDKRGKHFGNEDNPSAGHIAWLLWGGDEGRAWALELKKKIGNAPDI
jgi:hypothetical protein